MARLGMMLSLLSVLFFVGLGYASTINPLLVTDLPGYQSDAPNLTMFTGYVTVDESHNRNLFYWHVKSLNEPSTDPLVFWYNGGPGCSGLGGFFTENGPFTIDTNGNPAYNSLHWANIANVVWLEQPAGVGFSYSDDPQDYFTNDTRAAQDNYAFIQNFLQLFPEYSTSDIWLAGESYAGVYIPTLSSLIIEGADSLTDQLKGLMLGNPVNVCPDFLPIATAVQYNIYFWHGLVSPANFANWTSNSCDTDSSSSTCQEIFNIAQNQIGSIVQELTPLDAEPSLDPDDLYQDFCTGNGTLEYSVDNTSDCYPVGQRVQDYLNLAEVQTALAVQPVTWVDCTDAINYTVNFNYLNMNPHIQEAFKAGVNVLIYAGDVDIATVPAWYTVPCVNSLGSSLVEDWQPWFVNEATAGYVTVYSDFTFATLKGAGHEAPEYQPLNGFQLFQRFLGGDADLQALEMKEKRAKAAVARSNRKHKGPVNQGMRAREILSRVQKF